MRIGDDRQWYFIVTVRISGLKQEVRVVILWRYRRDIEPVKIPVANRITREVSRIVRVYRRRWTGMETFHRDGEQQLGLGDCRSRDVQGRTRHIDLVIAGVQSAHEPTLREGRAREWALHRLTAIGEACRAILKETLRTSLSRAIEQATRRERPVEHVIAQLALD